MGLLQAIVLAVAQGATEFLPVSSSGHMVLVPAFLGWQPAPLDYVIVVHFGTLMAVVAYYRRDLWAVLAAIFSGHRVQDKGGPLGNNDGRRLALLIIVATVPAAVAGLAFADFIDNLFTGAGPLPVAIALLVTSALLYAGDRFSGKGEPRGLSWCDAALIGVAQAIAIIPGVSRSGSTIAAGLWRGLSQEWAPRFAFLMSIPPIAGAFGIALKDAAGTTQWATELPCYVCGFVVSAVVGYISIYAVIRTVQQGRLFVRFGIYCLILGSFSILANLIGWV